MRGVVLAALLAANASAELTLDAAGWQSGRVEKPARPAVWTDAAVSPMDAKASRLLRGKAVLKNRGPKAAEGVLLRYSVTARLVPDRNAPAEAAWALPFMVDERRVPKIGPNQILEIPLTTTPKLELYVKRLARQGFKVNGLKLSAMLDPHDGGAVRLVEAILSPEQPK
ncbi:MAG: hypothetical protein M0D55_19615 [Elusimicrobiota bacterium]|nr:MAG: hypothetical protein M0D55_19615 [Elusimicrobiota bacterium]